MLLDGVGMSMYVHSDFVSYAVSAQEAATHGTLSIIGRMDASLMMTVAYSAMTTASGKQITTLEELAAYYMNAGADVQMRTVNGLPAVTYILPAGEMFTSGLCLISTDGMVLNFCAASFNADDCLLSYMLLLSITP